MPSSLNVPVYVYRTLDGSTFETQQLMAEDASSPAHDRAERRAGRAAVHAVLQGHPVLLDGPSNPERQPAVARTTG
jgi:hypothetical protein